VKIFAYFLSIALLVSVMAGISIYSQNTILNSEARQRIAHAEEDFQAMVDHDTHTLSAALRVFLENAPARELFLGGDRERLNGALQPLFQRLREDHGITHFYFIHPDGKVFLRLHHPDFHGDRVTRATFASARASGTISAGIELGKTAYALRVVAPYLDDGTLVGYVEFGAEIDHFLHLLKGNTANEFVLFGEKKYPSCCGQQKNVL